VNHGTRHSGFPDLPVYVNERAGQLTFWSEEPRQPWQTQTYYASQAATLHPLEYERIHHNKWVSSATSFLDDIAWWDKCSDPVTAYLDPNDKTTPLVVALDASVSRDCCALVGVSRHADDPWDAKERRVIQRHMRVWYPQPGQPMDYSLTIEPAIIEVAERHNVVEFCYDPYQLHNTATNMRKKGVGSFKEFSQMTRRAVADKQFYDMIIKRLFIHDGNLESRKHAMNAAAQVEGGKYLRIVKKAENRPIDLVVTPSMAIDECLRLNL
jgi:phage terminase large subunit-like protein